MELRVEGGRCDVTRRDLRVSGVSAAPQSQNTCASRVVLTPWTSGDGGSTVHIRRQEWPSSASRDSDNTCGRGQHSLTFCLVSSFKCFITQDR